MSKVIIVIEGGNVLNVYSNSNEQLDCEILDYDKGKIDEEADLYNDELVKEFFEDKNYREIY